VISGQTVQVKEHPKSSLLKRLQGTIISSSENKAVNYDSQY